MRLILGPIIQLASLPWRWFMRRRRLALLLVPFGLVAGRGEAGDEGVLWTPVVTKAADRTRYDLELTLRARRLLVDDPALARYEIMVRVDDRIAELSGPVPSMEIAQRAEEDLKGLLGLAGIRNRLTIGDSATPISQSTGRARFDLRYPEPEAHSTVTVSANAALASRLGSVPAEPTFSWRPASVHGPGSPFPIPFIPEGLSRPPGGRELVRESSDGGRENLRIGKVDTLSAPELNRQDSDLLVLPAIDLRHAEEKPAPGKAETRSSASPLYFFVGI
jgi:hypothetical protein